MSLELVKKLSLSMRKLESNKRGNTALMFALGGTVLAAAIGGGIEIARISQIKAEVQSALDSATLAAAKLGTSAPDQDKINAAKSAFNLNIANIHGIQAGSAVLTQDYSDGDKVKLSATVKVETILPVGIFGSFTNVGVSSESIESAPTVASGTCTQPTEADVTIPTSSVIKNNDACLIATDTASVTGMLFNNGVNISAPQCNFYDHAAGSSAATWNAGSIVSLANLFVKGGILNNASPNTNFHANTLAANMVNDPYTTGLPQPSGTPCTYNGLNFNADANLTPGTYCGWTNFNKTNGIVNMAPGLYIIRGGGWNLNSSQVTANGVAIFFEDNSNFALNSTASLNITAPVSGSYAGIAMYEKYNLTSMQRPFDASNGIKINGLVYFPTKELVFNSGNSVHANNTQIVGKRFIFNTIKWNLGTYISPPAAAASLGGILTNGSAENPAIATGTVSTPASVSGWNTKGGFIIHNSMTGSGYGAYGTDGSQYFKLNTDLYQTATTVKDKTYEFSFDFKYGNLGTTTDNKIEVVVNGIVLGTVTPVSGDPWKRITYPFVASNTSTVISLRQVTGANSANGAFIDRVVVTQNDAATAPATGCPGAKIVAAQPLRLTK